MIIVAEKHQNTSKLRNNSPFRRARTANRQIPRILSKLDKIAQLHPEVEPLNRPKRLRRRERQVYFTWLQRQRQQAAQGQRGKAA